jgi:CheY-like chemotaxis protein
METRSSSAVEPAPEPHAAPSSVTSTPNAPSALDATEPLDTTPYILLVDDNYINLKVMSRYLERRHGYPYNIATTGVEALEAFKTAASHQPPTFSHPTPPPSLSASTPERVTIDHGKRPSFDITPPNRPFTHIIMNPNLPHMDGLEATRQIRRFEDENDMIPVLIVGSGASALRKSRDEAMESGMDWYIFRPLTFSQLTRCFDEALDWL